MSRSVYVLGTGLSHDGSTCLLKDGEIIVGIEKERITRLKHDGGNDRLTVQYCLDYAGIDWKDLSLIVQSAHFEKDSIQKDRYSGARYFPADCTVPFVTISHHLAHAFSAIGTSPFNDCNVMVIDGSGSFYEQCDDLEGATIPSGINITTGPFVETNSFYHYDGKNLHPLFKDFSLIRYDHTAGDVYLPTARHSIGGLYAAASHYCFGSFHDAGKLMGLAPYGKKGRFDGHLFIHDDDRVLVNESVLKKYLTDPAVNYEAFRSNFEYYADIAKWVQDEAQAAILYLFNKRIAKNPHPHLCYAGGVALNAVTNSRLLVENLCEQLYIEPAAGDNGLALGAAYYGWLKVLGQPKIPHSGSTFFGKPYNDHDVQSSIQKHQDRLQGIRKYTDHTLLVTEAAALLAAGKTIGWFQLGSEFGPRALGHRSILADPRLPDIRQHINERIKLREDFRPFAPAVLFEDRNRYFKSGIESPYMILIDHIKEEWRDLMPGIVHVDGSCRVQTVKDLKDPFYQLLVAFRAITGISVLLNTSFNRMSMPIVETPADALDFFFGSPLDALVLNDHIFIK